MVEHVPPSVVSSYLESRVDGWLNGVLHCGDMSRWRWGVQCMSTNDQILLLEYLAQWQNERQLKYDESTIFELFAADQILKDHELSWDELESGLVDGGD